MYSSKGKSIRSVMSGVDNHIIIGGLKKPMLNAFIVAKIVEVVKRWKWGPELQTQLEMIML